MMPNKLAICPGSFDPITNSHLDIIQQGSTIFEEFIVLTSNNSTKSPLFTPVERVKLYKKSTKHFPNVTKDVSDKLLVYYAKAQSSNDILSGLRAESDSHYEMLITSMSKKF